MNALIRRLRGERGPDRHRYAPIGHHSRDESEDTFRSPRSRNIWTRKHVLILIMVGSLAAITAVLGIGSVGGDTAIKNPTDLFVILIYDIDIHMVPRARRLVTLPSKDISANQRFRTTLANTRLSTLSLPISRPIYRADAVLRLLSFFPDMELVILQ